jgi:hypothetical protein
MLSRMFAFGAGVPRNAERAQFWKRKAAEQGDAAAQASLGIDFLEIAKPVASDNTEASYWCRQSAEQGDSDGAACMGRLYDEGRGTFRDPARAAEWFRKSAEQRNPSGMVGLGILHYQGRGVAKDYVESLKWFLAVRDMAPVTASTVDVTAPRVYDNEIRAPQTWIAAVQRVVDQAQIDRARERAQAVLATAGVQRATSRGAAGDWLKDRTFCGDSASLHVPENEASLRTLPSTEKIVFEQQALSQQVKFFDNNRAVVMQDQVPKYLCTYAVTGRSARLSCPLSTYELTLVSDTEIRMRTAGPTVLVQAHPLVQRMRSDVSACRSAN